MGKRRLQVRANRPRPPMPSTPAPAAWDYSCLRCTLPLGEPVGGELFRLGEGLCRCVHPIPTKDGEHAAQTGLTLAEHNDRSIRDAARAVIAERTAPDAA